MNGPDFTLELPRETIYSSLIKQGLTVFYSRVVYPFMNFVTIRRFFLTTFTCIQDIDVIFINLYIFFSFQQTDEIQKKEEKPLQENFTFSDSDIKRLSILSYIKFVDDDDNVGAAATNVQHYIIQNKFTFTAISIWSHSRHVKMRHYI